MKNLLIIGARGFGREVFTSAVESQGYGTEFTIKGFLDSQKEVLNGFEGYPPIIESAEKYQPREDDVFITALGDVQAKIKYSTMVLDKGGEFYTLIHKSAFLHPSVKLGKGCLIMRYATISNDVKIGDHVTLMNHIVIGHDARIGSWSHLGPFVFMGGRSTTEANVQMHVRSTVLADKHIGKNSTVGAGSVVIKNVEEYTTVFGNPAKSIYNTKP